MRIYVCNRSEATIKTTCEFCVFAKKIDNTQIGCELDRLDKYEKTFVNNHYEIEGFCNFCRNIYWPNANSNNKIADVKKEEEVKYSVIYNYDGDDEAIVNSITSVCGDLEPVDFIVCYDETIEKPVNELLQLLKPIFNRVTVTQSINETENYYGAYETAIKRAKGNYVYFLPPNHKLDKKSLSHLNFVINDEVKSVYMIVNNDFVVCYKKLLEKYMFYQNPVSIIHDALLNSKHKDSVIQWPLK